MPRLVRVHFSGLGLAATRMDPLTLDFTDSTGRPDHGVIWLENGGGKSTWLSIFFSLIRPNEREFLGKLLRKKDTWIGEYIGDLDTAHIIAEWDLGDALGKRGKPGDRWITGRLLEWKDRRQSSIRDDLNRCFWYAKLGDGLNWDSFPIVGMSDQKPLRYREMREWFKILPEQFPNSHAEIVDGVGQWVETIGDIGIDSEAILTQIKLNAGEGGDLDKFFKKSCENPIKFFNTLLDLAFDYEAAGETLTIVDQHRTQLQEKPSTELSLELDSRLLDIVEMVVRKREPFETAQKEMSEGIEQTRLLARGILQARMISSEREIKEGESISLAEGKLREIKKALDNTERYLQGYQLIYHKILVQEADAEVGLAEREKISANLNEKAIGPAENLLAKKEFESELSEIERQLTARNEVRAPVKERLLKAGNRLAGFLSLIGEKMELRVDGLSKQKKDLLTAELAIEERKTLLITNRAKAEAQRSDLEQRLFERSQMRTKLTELGATEPREMDVENALRHWNSEISRIQNEIGYAELALEEHKTALRTAAYREKETASEKAEVSTLYSEIQNQLKEANQEREILENHPLLKQVQGEETALDHPGLLSRISKIIREHLDQTVSLSAELMWARFSETYMGQKNLLPPPEEVRRSCRILREAGVDGVTPALEYLADKLDSPERAQELILSDPSRFSGIFVHTEAQMNKALGYLATIARPEVHPFTISIVSLEATSRYAEKVILPVSQSSYNRNRVAEETEVIRKRKETAEEIYLKSEKDNRQWTDFDSDLRRVLIRWPSELVRELREKSFSCETRLQHFSQEAGVIAGEILRLEEAIKVAEATLTGLREAKPAGEKKRDAVKDFIERYELKYKSWSDEYAALGNEIPQITEHIEGFGKQKEELRSKMSTVADTLASVIADQRQITQEMTSLQYENTFSPVLDDTVEAARVEYEMCLNELRGLDDAALLGEQKQINKGLSKIHSLLQQTQIDVLEIANHWIAINCFDAIHCQNVRTARDSANETHTLAVSKLQTEKNRLDAIKKSHPPRFAREDRDNLPADKNFPQTSSEALDGVKEMRSQLDKTIEAKGELDKELSNRNETIELIRHQIRQADLAVRQIDDALNDLPGTLGDGEFVFPESDLANSPEIALDAIRKTKDQRSRFDAKRREVVALISQARNLIAKPEYERLPRTMERRLSEVEDPTVWVTNAANWSKNLSDLVEALKSKLTSIKGNQILIVKEMNRIAADIRGLLRAAELNSIIEAPIPGWQGQPYLKIDLPWISDEAERLALLSELLESMIAKKDIPKANEFCAAILQQLASRRKCSASILKPTVEKSARRYPVEELANFSGGEGITVAQFLLASLSKLRGQARDGRKSAGIMLLDNPIGQGSRADLVRTQLEMATLSGIQMIVLTGINDPEAVAQFPVKQRIGKVVLNRRTGIKELGLVDARLHSAKAARKNDEGLAQKVFGSTPADV